MDLKKKTNIESSGHLSHHLSKLDRLIKTDAYGKYCLSDQGRDALLTVQNVEKETLGKSKFEGKRPRWFKVGIGLKTVSFVLVMLLIAVSTVAVFEHNQVATLQNSISSFVANDYFSFYDEFGVVPQTNVNSSWAPPVSMLAAARIGLEAQGYNRTSLSNRQVGASLFHLERGAKNQSFLSGYNVNCLKVNGTVVGGFDIVTSSPQDYLPIVVGDVVSGYVWLISVSVESPSNYRIMWTVSYVDAVTGELVLPYF